MKTKESAIDLSNTPHTEQCFERHLGIWAVSEEHANEVLSTLGLGVLPQDPTPESWRDLPVTWADSLGLEHQAVGQTVAYKAADGTVREGFRVLYDRVGPLAVIPVVGRTQKSESSMGGTSTLRVRRALARAAADDDVRAGLMVIDSPGGTVPGLMELYQSMERFVEKKPLRVHIEDTATSAALYIASAGQRLTANEPAVLGSIGVFAVVEDLSERAEQMGVKVHLISSGGIKGAGVPGTEVPKELLADIQQHVDRFAAQFISAVARGRGLEEASVRKLADGSTFGPEEAVGHGLIDAVQPLDQTVAELVEEHSPGKSAARMRAQARQSQAEAELTLPSRSC